MKPRILITPEAATHLSKLHIDTQREIKRALKTLTPHSKDLKPLRGRLAGLHSVRVRRHRLILRASPRVMEVVDVGHRHSIYNSKDRTGQNRTG